MGKTTIIQLKKNMKCSICSCGMSKKLPYCDNAHRDYNKHNNTNYKSVKVVSSGDRDPDAEGVAGMSASKMREMAKQNDFKTFKTGLTRNLSDRDAKQLFDAVKKGMGINERYESFTDFLNNDLRE